MALETEEGIARATSLAEKIQNLYQMETLVYRPITLNAFTAGAKTRKSSLSQG